LSKLALLNDEKETQNFSEVGSSVLRLLGVGESPRSCCFAYCSLYV